MPWKDYLTVFDGTCINVDSPQRAHYSISSAGTNMREKKDYFFSFVLSRAIDCRVDSFGIICE
jgi:hypothetical protein